MSSGAEIRKTSLDVLYGNDYFYAARKQRAVKMIELAIPPLENHQTLLEIGTGTGDMFLALSGKYHGQVYSLDVSSEVPKRNEQNLKETSSYRLIADGTKIPFGDKTFDLVFVCFVLHHVPDTDIPRIIRESIRVGKDVIVLENNVKHPSFKHIQARQIGEGVADGLINIGIPGDFLANFKGADEWETIFQRCGAADVHYQDHPFNIGPIGFHQSIFHISDTHKISG